MKPSLRKDLIRYAKTKGRAPLDERQMDTLKALYIELAKSTILLFMFFIVVYGFMELRQQESEFNFFALGESALGALTYYYFLRFCYQQVIGIDVNFEVLLVPALCFSPMLVMNAILVLFQALGIGKPATLIVVLLLPLYFILLYLGANRVYQKGRIEQERQIQHAELHFRSRKQITNYAIVIIVIIALFPISYDLLFKVCLVIGLLLTIYQIWYYGFHTPRNEYILNETGLFFHKSLWNGKGQLLPYERIERIEQRDTFNIGYCKDKVCIYCKDGSTLLLYPENAYQFCVELENNL